VDGSTTSLLSGLNDCNLYGNANLAGPDLHVSERPVVQLEHLEVVFQRDGSKARALKDISLEIAPGEILAIAGESGSGKTVLGLSILGLLPTHPAPIITGKLEVSGVDMLRANPRELQRLRATHLGAVFQDPMTSLNPTMTIGNQLGEVTRDQDESIALLASVGLPDPELRLRSYPHELSGGQRQRVMLAMAISRRPALLVTDEPTTALDVTVQAQVLELLVNLRDQTGSSMLFITHDLGVAARVADRIAVMYSGRIVEIGTTSEILSDPSHPYTRALLRSRLSLNMSTSRPIPQMRGEMPSVYADLVGCSYGPRCDQHIEACDAGVPALVAATRSGHSTACIKPPAKDFAKPIVTRVGKNFDSRSEKSLIVKDLEVRYPVRTGVRKKQQLAALRGVSLEVAHGECVSLVGESGCGKSTLLRVVAGLERSSSGSVEFHQGGFPQMVFQDAGASLTPWLSVKELVGERLHRNGLDPAERATRIRDVLELVGLPMSLLDSKPRELSGGQRQRLAFARAIAVPPSVLLADEPTSALDVSLAAVVLNLVGSLRRELDMTVLFVTHDIAAARLISDRIAVMYLGRIVEQGPAEEVTRNPVHPYTQALIAAVPSLSGKSNTSIIRGEPASPLNPPAGCAYHPRCPVRITTCSIERPMLMALDGQPDISVACVHTKEGR